MLNVTFVEFIGLTDDYNNVIICGNRGQSNGSNGNWNVFNLTASGFYTENITYGNYCTVDLVFSLKPELNRPRRTNNGVQAQLFGFSSITGKVWANRSAFVSRLNLTPPAGNRTLYTNCHFESTDNSLMKGVYNDEWDPLGVKSLIETANADNVPIQLTISPTSRSITTETGSVTLTTTVAGSTTVAQNNAGEITWAIAPDYVQYSENITLTPSANGKTCTVTGINNTYAPFSVVITATSTIGLQGASLSQCLLMM